jgi:Kef-type K+ transport system membrane component KefB
MPEPQRGIEPGNDAASLNPGSRGVLGLIVLVCGAITTGTGVLIILVARALGSDAVAAMGAGYIPSVNTALLFVLIGIAVPSRLICPIRCSPSASRTSAAWVRSAKPSAANSAKARARVDSSGRS